MDENKAAIDDDEKENDIHVDDETARDETEVVTFKYSITSYGADYPVDSLVKRLREESIFVPKFQREYVWNMSDASSFVESLLLGLPVPGVFFSKEDESQKLLVIDGQQRLKSLQFFYDGVFVPTGKVFGLQGVQKRFKGITYKTLEDEDRRRLDDSIIHATVVRQEVPSDDNSSVYYIFERLNTRGRRLHPQEIRASIYHGAFHDLVEDLNKNEHWRMVYGKPSPRLKDQELILRFLALHFNWENYERPMKEFLNKYMAANRNFRREPKQTLSLTFERTTRFAVECLGERVFKPGTVLNAAVFDAVMVGLSRRLNSGPVDDRHLIKRKYETLLKDTDFADAYEHSTSNEEKVRRRIELAIEAFANVK